MKRRNQILLLVSLALILLNFAGYFAAGSWRGNVDTDLFAVSDTSDIRSIEFVGPEHNYSIARAENDWQVNGTHNIDASFRNILMAVLSRVQVKNRLGGAFGEKLLAKAGQEGVLVKVNGSAIFRVLGNATKTRTYFVDASGAQVFEVNIPGYRDFIGSIFQLTPTQWRERTLFAGSARTIQKLSIDYPADPDLTVTYNGDFFDVDRVAVVDTAALENYLDQFVRLQANERIDLGRFPQYDSLSKTTPRAILQIESLTGEPVRLNIFDRLGRDRFHLVQDQQGELTVFEARRINALLKKPDYFDQAK